MTRDSPGRDRRADPSPRVDRPAAPARARRSCRARSTRPSSTRRSCASSSASSLLMRSPVRGGLKGGRRSVKRGPVGRVRRLPRLHPRRRPAPARLERLRPARAAVRQALRRGGGRHRHAPRRCLGVDGGGRPGQAAVRQARRRRARLHRARERGPGRGQRARRAHRPAAGRRCAARAGSSGCSPTCRRSSPADGPTDLVAAARHAAAQLHGRGVVILLSDLLDPAADRVIRELAATGSELIVLHVLSPDELDPVLEGDLRLVDSETGDGIDVTVDLATIDAYKARLAAWKAGFADLAAKRRRELRRPVVRRRTSPTSCSPSCAAAGCWARPMPFITPLALLGLLFIPAVIAMYLLKLRRDEAVVPSTLLWSRLAADVEANAPWQRLRRSLLLLLQLLLVDRLVAARGAAVPRAAGGPRPGHRPGHGHVGQHGRHGRRAEPARGRQGGRARGARGPADRRPGQRHRRRPDRPDRGQRDDRPGPRPPGARRHRSRRPAAATSATPSSSPASSPRARATPRSSSPPTPPSRPSPTATVDAPIKVLPVGRDRKNQAIVALAVRTVAVGGHALGLRQRREPRPRERASAGSRSGATTALLEARDLTLDAAGAVRRRHRRRAARRRGRRGPPRRRATRRPRAAPDQLAIDDRAWAVVPPDADPADPARRRRRPVPRDRALVPAERRAVRRDAGRLRPATRAHGRPAVGPDDLRGALPATLPTTPILAIAPPPDQRARRRDRHAQGPGHRVARARTSRSCATSTSRRPTSRRRSSSRRPTGRGRSSRAPRARRSSTPASRAGLPTAVLAFEPRRSDLPLQVAFPILLANLTGELLGGSAAPTEAVAPGTPVSLTIPSGATGVTVTRPDGTIVELVPATGAGASVYVRRDRAPGHLHRHPDPVRRRVADPSASGRQRAPPTPLVEQPGRRASAAAPAPPGRPERPGPLRGRPLRRRRIDIAPGSAAAIEGLGRRAGPVRRRPGTAPPRDRPTARDELWIPIVLLVLVGLCVEWAVYHRDAVIRMRAVAGRALRADQPGRDDLMGIAFDAPLALAPADPGPGR